MCGMFVYEHGEDTDSVTFLELIDAPILTYSMEQNPS
jgi:hypothetical protein